MLTPVEHADKDRSACRPIWRLLERRVHVVTKALIRSCVLPSTDVQRTPQGSKSSVRVSLYPLQREEVFKAQVLPALLTMLDRGSTEERWAACGALHALAHSEKHIAEVVNTKMIVATSSLLSSAHDRSKQVRAGGALLPGMSARPRNSNSSAISSSLPCYQRQAQWAMAHSKTHYIKECLRVLLGVLLRAGRCSVASSPCTGEYATEYKAHIQ